MNQQTLRYAVLEDQEAFAKLEREWNGLCGALGNTVTVFSSYMWYQNWWRFYGAGAKINLFTMWQDARLVGIAPLMLKKYSLHGLPVRRIGFMENNQSLHNDFIVLPEFRTVFLQKLLQTLFEQAGRWDVLYFRNLSLQSENFTALKEILADEIRSWKVSSTPIDSPYLIPTGNWQGFLAGRSRRTRKNLKNIRNRILKAGEVVVRNITTWEEFLACRDELFTVAQQSWTESVGDSLGSSVNRNFYESLAHDAAAKGWLSIWALYLDGRMIAAEFHLKAYGREHALRGHYLPEFAALSPGTYLEMAILQHIFDVPDTTQVYDFCGSFEKYKKKWTETSVAHCDIRIFADRLYSKVLRFQELRIEPLLKMANHYARLLQQPKRLAKEKNEILQ